MLSWVEHEKKLYNVDAWFLEYVWYDDQDPMLYKKCHAALTWYNL